MGEKNSCVCRVGKGQEQKKYISNMYFENVFWLVNDSGSMTTDSSNVL